MSVGDKLSEFSSQMQSNMKSGFLLGLGFFLKVITGLLLGLTLTLVLQEIFQFGSFVFFFSVTGCTLLFLRLAKNWSLLFLLVFNLLAVLSGLLVRMYILVAPG